MAAEGGPQWPPAWADCTWNTFDFLLLYKNTFFVVVLTMFIEVPITFASSYVLARFTFKKERTRKRIEGYLMLGLAVPAFVLLFPIYRLVYSMHLYGTHFSLVVPYVATSIAFNTLIFTNFLRALPKEIEEAALIDGCNLWQLCVHVIVPILKPAVITVLVFNVLYIWNEYPFASTLITDSNLYTISLGTSFFKGAWSIDYGGLIAASVLMIIPQLLFFAFFQSFIIDGMTAGAVKG